MLVVKTFKIVNPRSFLAAISVVLLASCSAPAPQSFNDPHEEENRRTHETNRRVDTAILKPASGAYGTGLPAPVRQGIGNFASNLNLPGVVVNNLLQLNIEGALQNTWRFLINTTVGIGGIFDPSASIKLYEDSSDFGETLHVWGMGEGEYVELPFVGPSTQRDAIGMVVDVFTNPLTFGAPSPERFLSPVVKGLAKIGDRYTYSDSVDAILYDSADSYAQARLMYLQHRRFQLGQEQVEQNQGDDGYDDFYAD